MALNRMKNNILVIIRQNMYRKHKKQNDKKSLYSIIFKKVLKYLLHIKLKAS